MYSRQISFALNHPHSIEILEQNTEYFDPTS